MTYPLIRIDLAIGTTGHRPAALRWRHGNGNYSIRPRNRT
jgi:hypothetical protein